MGIRAEPLPRYTEARARRAECRRSLRAAAGRHLVAHHRNQPLFGQERLIDVIRQAPADIDTVADAILAAVTAYGPAEPRDDVAVVVGRIDS